MGQSSFIKSSSQRVAQHEKSILSSPSKLNRSRLPLGAQTDPNSIYRKLYNRNMDFFLWILDREPAPYTFKLHVQAQTKNEMKVAIVKRSVQSLIPQHATSNSAAKKTAAPKVQAQYFTKKKQFKVFVEFSDSKQAQQFFMKTFVMKTLPILDESFQEIFTRDMRVYLVKTEEEFTQFALTKYQEEIKEINIQQQSTSSRSNQRGRTQKTQDCTTKSQIRGT